MKEWVRLNHKSIISKTKSSNDGFETRAKSHCKSQPNESQLENIVVSKQPSLFRFVLYLVCIVECEVWPSDSWTCRRHGQKLNRGSVKGMILILRNYQMVAESATKLGVFSRQGTTRGPSGVITAVEAGSYSLTAQLLQTFHKCTYTQIIYQFLKN